MTERVIGPTGSRRRRRSLLGSFITALVLALALGVPAAIGSHPEVSLAGSNFEIDTNANLKQDDASPSIDWNTVANVAVPDAQTGSGDDSFGEGAKEDTAVPTVVSGSIPPNKSDLKTFSVFREEGGTAGFLHMYWSRVQDPKGTTNMDFEFNRNKCDPADVANSTCSANGVTPVRSEGDLLIIYDLSRGGTVPTLSLREWNGSAWGDPEDLTASGKATGSINTSPILAADSEIGALDTRTFGEATVDLTAVFDPNTCESFGSVYLKSRSSDSFDAALKDFIAPKATTISNCGTVIIRKVTSPPSTDSFAFTSNIVTSPATTTSPFNVLGGGSKTFANVISGSYTVTETPIPANYTLTSINCNASTVPAANRTATVASANVVFTIAAGQTLDCTFTNTKSKNSPSATTAPTLVPQDSATVSGLDTSGSVDGAFDKELHFELYNNAGCTGTPLYATKVTVTANTTYATDNLGSSPSGYTISADGTYKWKVYYDGDSRNNPFGANSCGDEQVIVDVTPNPTP
jgi:hypothetical protein